MMSKKKNGTGTWRWMSSMKFGRAFLVATAGLCILSASVHGQLEVKEPEAGITVDFEKDLLPVLKKNCLACHNTTKARGDLNLETPALIRKGGSSGKAVVPGDPEDSLIYISAAHQDEDLIMPPEGNKVKASNFSPVELGLLKRWIEGGATGEVSSVPDVAFENLELELNPIHSLDVSQAGDFVMCGRGNRLYVHDLVRPGRFQELPGRIGSESGSESGGGDRAAHKDLVHSIAIHPSGNLAATGDFREINIWKREDVVYEPIGQRGFGGMVTAVSSGKTHGQAWGGDVYGNVGLWHSDDNKISWKRSPHAGTIQALIKVSGAIGEIVSVSADGLIAVWNARDRDPQVEFDTGMSISCAEILATEAGGEILLCGLDDGRVLVKNLSKTGESDRFLTIGRSRVTGIAVAASGEVSEILVSFDDGQLSLVSVDSTVSKRVEKWVRRLKVSHIAISDGGVGAIAVVTEDGGKIHLLSRENGETTRTLHGERGLHDAVDHATLESVFYQNEIQFSEKQIEGNKKEVESQKKRSSDAAQEAKEKEEGHKKALAEFKAKSDELDKARLRITSLEEEVAKAREEAELARARHEQLEKQLISQLAEGAVPVEDLSTGLKKVGEAAFKSGQKDIHAESIEKTNKPLITGAQEKIKPIQKAFSELEKKEMEAALGLKLIQDELELAGLAVVRAEEVFNASVSLLENAKKLHAEYGMMAENAKEALSRYQRVVGALAFSEDGELLLVADYNGGLSLWDVDIGINLGVFPLNKKEKVQVFALDAVGAESDTMIAGTSHGWMGEINFSRKWQFDRRIGDINGSSPVPERVYSLSFNRDGTQLVAGCGVSSRSGLILLLETETGEVIKSLDEVHSDVIYGLDFSWDGMMLASASADKFVRVVDIDTGKILHHFEGHSHYVMDVSWHRNNRNLLSASADNEVKLWDRTTGQSSKSIKVSNKEATSVVYLPYTDKFLISAGDNQISQYDQGGKKVRGYSGPEDYMVRARSDRKGSLVAAGGQSGILYIWDAGDGKLLQKILPPTRRSNQSVVQRQ